MSSCAVRIIVISYSEILRIWITGIRLDDFRQNYLAISWNRHGTQSISWERALPIWSHPTQGRPQQSFNGLDKVHRRGSRQRPAMTWGSREHPYTHRDEQCGGQYWHHRADGGQGQYTGFNVADVLNDHFYLIVVMFCDEERRSHAAIIPIYDCCTMIPMCNIDDYIMTSFFIFSWHIFSFFVPSHLIIMRDSHFLFVHVSDIMRVDFTS